MERIEVLKAFGVEAEESRFGGFLDIANPLIGKGVSLTQENGNIKLSLTGCWIDLEDANEHLRALTKGISILEALEEASKIGG